MLKLNYYIFKEDVWFNEQRQDCFFFFYNSLYIILVQQLTNYIVLFKPFMYFQCVCTNIKYF